MVLYKIRHFLVCITATSLPSLTSTVRYTIYISLFFRGWIQSTGQSTQGCRSLLKFMSAMGRGRCRSLHDLASRDRCDKLQRNLSVGQDVLGNAGALLDVGEDERGAARRGDDAVWGARRLHRRHHGTARVHAFFVLVSFNVLRQVVAPHEALGTFRADELLLPCRKRTRGEDWRWMPLKAGGCMGWMCHWRADELFMNQQLNLEYF